MRLDYEEELRNYWGEDLIRFSAESLMNFPLSYEEKYLLVSVGLPNLRSEAFQFCKSVSELKILNCKKFTCLIIGRFGRFDFGIDVDNRHVHFIDENCTKQDFLNSNLEALLVFIMRSYQLYYTETLYDNWTEEKTNIIIDKLEKEFNKIDPATLEDKKSFWPVKLEEMRFGLV